VEIFNIVLRKGGTFRFVYHTRQNQKIKKKLKQTNQKHNKSANSPSVRKSGLVDTRLPAVCAEDLWKRWVLCPENENNAGRTTDNNSQKGKCKNRRQCVQVTGVWEYYLRRQLTVSRRRERLLNR